MDPAPWEKWSRSRRMTTAQFDPSTIPSQPDPSLRFRRKVSVRETWRELRRSKELIIALTERDFRAQYKQEFVGVTWAVITPIVFMVVFTVFFKKIGNVNTGDIPYPLFSYLGLLPWTFFSSSLDSSDSALINNISLLNKVYCPREIFVFSTIAGMAITTVIQTGMLIVLFVFYRFMPAPTSYYAPLLILILVMFTTGTGLVAASVTVYVRDLRRIIPMLLQVGLFATPVGYPLTKLPESSWMWVSAVNPLVPVIDGLRRCILDGVAPQWNITIVGGVMSLIWLVVGYYTFKKLETGIADVA